VLDYETSGYGYEGEADYSMEAGSSLDTVQQHVPTYSGADKDVILIVSR